jgi:insertion element IS1 protein InsB
MSDYWRPYETFIPNALHTPLKAETYAVEGYNSLFRHFLARLRCQSKCYSKSQEMLKYSILLLMLNFLIIISCASWLTGTSWLQFPCLEFFPSRPEVAELVN